MGDRCESLARLAGGFALILSTPVLRATYLITIGMGVFFGGVFLVLLPLAVRDLYAGGARDISFAYVAFGLGTLLCIVGLMRRGGARRPGRALLVSQGNPAVLVTRPISAAMLAISAALLVAVLLPALGKSRASLFREQ